LYHLIASFHHLFSQPLQGDKTTAQLPSCSHLWFE
jgi:hypothetical protein